MPDVDALGTSDARSSQTQSQPPADLSQSQQTQSSQISSQAQAQAQAQAQQQQSLPSSAALRSHLHRTSSSTSSPTSSPSRYPKPYNTAELHQELEREQEAVVNRLLHQIRSTAESLHASNSNAIDESTTPTNVPAPNSNSSLAAGHILTHSRHNSLSARSRTSSRTSSPLLQPSMLDPLLDPFMMGGRDEVAFYKTETDMLARENEMLKRRIRELEEQATKKVDKV